MLDDKAATNVSEHILTCEKHPMRQVEHELSDMQFRLKKTVGEIYHINFDYPLIEQVLTIFHTNFPEVLK